MLRSRGNQIIRARSAGRPVGLIAVEREPNKSFKLTGPLVTRLASRRGPCEQAARQPSLQLNSTVRLAGLYSMIRRRSASVYRMKLMLAGLPLAVGYLFSACQSSNTSRLGLRTDDSVYGFQDTLSVQLTNRTQKALGIRGKSGEISVSLLRYSEGEWTDVPPSTMVDCARIAVVSLAPAQTITISVPLSRFRPLVEAYYCLRVCDDTPQAINYSNTFRVR